MITKNIIVHALPRIYCLFQCLVLFPCLFKCHGFVIISPLLIACPFLNVPSILIIIKIPMFSFHKHTVNDNVNNLCMYVCVCVWYCWMFVKNNPSQENTFCCVMLHLPPHMSLLLCFSSLMFMPT